jgi:predicted lipoprotein with Yx(FWY)xxD motif
MVVALLLVGVTAALASATTTIRSVSNPTLGRILEGPSRYTLYVFCRGATERCAGHSSPGWPPLIAGGRPVAARGSRIKATRLGTRKLRSGKRQVTYYGQPLYLYKGDHKAGQANGENKTLASGSWFVISTTGQAVVPQCPPTYPCGSG